MSAGTSRKVSSTVSYARQCEGGEVELLRVLAYFETESGGFTWAVVSLGCDGSMMEDGARVPSLNSAVSALCTRLSNPGTSV